MKWAFINTDTLLVPPQKVETIDTANKNNKIFTLKHRYTQMYTYIHTQHTHIQHMYIHTQLMYTQHPCNSPHIHIQHIYIHNR